MSTKLKDSGKRQSFKTGAVRDIQEEKGRFDLGPEEALMLGMQIYQAGAIKYEARNWEKGIPISRFLDSALRHLYKYKAGMRDEPHLSMALWNVLSALQTAVWVHRGVLPAELFDLPNHISKKKIGPLSKTEEHWLWA
jgi:hypothetical protein